MTYEHQPSTAQTPETNTTGRINIDRLMQAGRHFEYLVEPDLQQAELEQREITDETARVIAHCLGRAYGRGSHLAEYGRTGDGGYDTLRDEYLDIYIESRTPDQIRTWIDWLGTYLMHQAAIQVTAITDGARTRRERTVMNDFEQQQSEEHIPQPDTQDIDPRLAAELMSGIENHGDAFEVYLAHVREPSRQENLEEDFRNVYWGQYPDRKAFVDSNLEALDWRDAVDSVIAQVGIPHGVLNWNYPMLLAYLEAFYDIYDHKGTIHVFLK